MSLGSQSSPEVGTAAELVLDANALNQLRTCKTCCGQGAKGFVQLDRVVKAAQNAPWVKRIPLNEAVMSDNLSCLRYLVDDVEVETLNAITNGYTPLQLSIVWGKVEVMVYLFSRGADPMLDTESSVVDKARLRQQRLHEAHERSGDGVEFEGFSITKSRIEPLIEEGRAMLKILEGIEEHGSYQTWAENNANHPLVRRFSSDIRTAEPHYQMALIRALVQAERAELLSAADRAAIAAEEAAKAAERAKNEQALTDALEEAGFAAPTAKEIRDCFRVPTLKALRNLRLTQEDIEKRLEPSLRQKRIREGEQRRFIRYVRELEEPPPPQAAPKPAAKAKAKAKGAYPAAMAALMAAGSKGAGKGAKEAAAKSAASKKPAQIDAMALIFGEKFPLHAFANVSRFMFGC